MSQKEKNKIVIIYTVIFSLAAHIYAWVNSFFSHDGLMIYHVDDNWQVSLGRFLHPAYLYLRGRLTSPITIALLGTIFLTLSVILICKLLKIEKKSTLILVSGILSTNIVLTCLNASFLLSLDFDMLALLFSVLAVYLCVNVRFGVLWGSLCIVASLGLFQSFYQVSVFLFMVYIMIELLNNKNCIKLIIKALSTLILGGILYYFVYNIFLSFYNIEASTIYNSITGVGNFAGHSIFTLFKETYIFFYNYMQNLATHNASLVAILNLIFLFSGLFAIGYEVIKNKISKLNMALLILLIILMPFGINCVYFISKGLMHSLMTYSYFLFYVWALWCWEKIILKKNHKWLNITMIILFGSVIFNGIVYANQMHLKKELESQGTLSMMTRIVEEMEEVEGYVAGETPVLIAGTLINNYSMVNKSWGFSDHFEIGTWFNYAVTFELSYQYYFNFILGYPVNWVPETEVEYYLNLPQVQEMAIFPTKGYCKMVEGVLVIRLAENIERMTFDTW